MVLRPATQVEVAAIKRISMNGMLTVRAIGRESRKAPVAMINKNERTIIRPGENCAATFLILLNPIIVGTEG